MNPTKKTGRHRVGLLQGGSKPCASLGAAFGPGIDNNGILQSESTLMHIHRSATKLDQLISVQHILLASAIEPRRSTYRERPKNIGDRYRKLTHLQDKLMSLGIPPLGRDDAGLANERPGERDHLPGEADVIKSTANHRTRRPDRERTKRAILYVLMKLCNVMVIKKTHSRARGTQLRNPSHRRPSSPK